MQTTENNTRRIRIGQLAGEVAAKLPANCNGYMQLFESQSHPHPQAEYFLARIERHVPGTTAKYWGTLVETQQKQS